MRQSQDGRLALDLGQLPKRGGELVGLDVVVFVRETTGNLKSGRGIHNQHGCAADAVGFRAHLIDRLLQAEASVDEDHGQGFQIQHHPVGDQEHSSANVVAVLGREVDDLASRDRMAAEVRAESDDSRDVERDRGLSVGCPGGHRVQARALHDAVDDVLRRLVVGDELRRGVEPDRY
jgi:hypothetical protein